MTLNPFKALFKSMTKTLMKDGPARKYLLTDFERLRYELRPGDVLLISGRNRVSEVIKIITQSQWSHAALYIGRLHDIESEDDRHAVAEHYPGKPTDQLLIESEMGKGTVVTPLTYYHKDHLRICRPIGLSRQDAHKVIGYAIKRLGVEYDIRQIMDLARFMFPWSLLPRRWRSSLFYHNVGGPTKQSCASIIAEAFESVHFPILPLIKKVDAEHVKYYARIPRLYTPSDFDFSPYFDIIKYPIFHTPGRGVYRDLPWNEDGHFSDAQGNVYIPEKESHKYKPLEHSQKSPKDSDTSPKPPEK